jgi:hypothetical protein
MVVARLGIWITIGSRVGVLDPVNALGGDHHVRILVQEKIGCEHSDPLQDAAPKEHPGFLIGLCCKKKISILEIDSEQELSEKGGKANATTASIV